MSNETDDLTENRNMQKFSRLSRVPMRPRPQAGTANVTMGGQWGQNGRLQILFPNAGWGKPVVAVIASIRMCIVRLDKPGIKTQDRNPLDFTKFDKYNGLDGPLLNCKFILFIFRLANALSTCTELCSPHSFLPFLL